GPHHRRVQATAHGQLGDLLGRSGRPADAEREFRTAVEVFRRLAADHPAVADYRADAAGALNSLAGLLLALDRVPDGEAALRAAAADYEALTARRPGHLPDRQSLAVI